MLRLPICRHIFQCSVMHFIIYLSWLWLWQRSTKAFYLILQEISCMSTEGRVFFPFPEECPSVLMFQRIGSSTASMVSYSSHRVVFITYKSQSHIFIKKFSHFKVLSCPDLMCVCSSYTHTWTHTHMFFSHTIQLNHSLLSIHSYQLPPLSLSPSSTSLQFPFRK